MNAAHVIIVGAGGNIGSHLVPHIVRMTGVRKLTLIDRDTYEAGNLSGQNIVRRDVGRKKALVQARRAKEIRPDLEVVPLPHAVEDLPLGRLRGDVILACLDSRVARQVVNQAAFWLGVPWIDSGVEATGTLARVTVYTSSSESPCLECAWDDRDYAALEVAHPCRDAVVRPTRAPSSLGALAACLQAIECQKLFEGRPTASTEVVLDAAHQKHYVTRLRRNPGCRFSPHETWKIKELRKRPREIRLSDVMDHAFLQVAGRAFARDLVCSRCARVSRTLTLRSRLPGCHHCGGERVPSGFGRLERLDVESLSKRDLARTLFAIGVRTGDILSVGGEKHVAIGMDEI